MGRRIYVETVIDAPMDALWEHTQDPATHARWDLRFGSITALQNKDAQNDDAGSTETAQHFSYATTILPGLTVAGTGTHAGQQRRQDGSATSALRFGSEQRLSIIEAGSGYWRYLPQEGGTVTFLTGYDYFPRWGRLGRLIDSVLFRPAIGWATAFSFDRLRLWLERDITPERSRHQALAEVVVRLLTTGVVVALDWRWGLGVAALAILLPPLSSTPAARRCRRRPAGREQRLDVSAALDGNNHQRGDR